MGMCDAIARFVGTNCVLAEGHLGGHRGVFYGEFGGKLVIAWHEDTSSGEPSDPIIVGSR